jgi:hypothetical protein
LSSHWAESAAFCSFSILCVFVTGRLPSNVRQTGQILVNGVKQVLTYGNSVSPLPFC